MSNFDEFDKKENRRSNLEMRERPNLIYHETEINTIMDFLCFNVKIYKPALFFCDRKIYGS